MQHKISIIVPVYNSETFLEKCLDSILSQKYSNFELVLINDGSTDNSDSICTKYNDKFSAVKYHKFAKNRGVSCARNAGLEEAEGALIGFVDSDDWIEPQMYEKLYNTLMTNNASIASSNYRHVDYNSDIVKTIKPYHNSDFFIDNTLDALLYIIDNDDVVLCNKLFRREVFGNILFPETKVYEDIGTAHLLIENAGNLAVTSEHLYNYHLQPKSITRDNISPKRYFDHLFAVIDRYDNLMAKYNCEKLENLCRLKIFTTLLHITNIIMGNSYTHDDCMVAEYQNIKDTVFNKFTYEACGFNDVQKRLIKSLSSGLSHYRIQRDLLRV